MIRTDIMKVIKVEVQKLVECDFIREDQHLDWVTIVVPVLKKHRKI